MDVSNNSYKFIIEKVGSANFIFSTANNNLDFNKNKDYGINNLNNIKKWFGVKKVGFLNQIHSDRVIVYDDKNFIDGDAIITNKVKTAIGIFTADCVPILLYDIKNSIIAAIHSGWKGTFNVIVTKTINSMENIYGTNSKDIITFIGPHIRPCCYEISEELKNKFNNHFLYSSYENIFTNNKLNLQECIKIQLINKGIGINNIRTNSFCTFCNKEYDFFSYRRQKQNAGRMFSFIYLD